MSRDECRADDLYLSVDARDGEIRISLWLTGSMDYRELDEVSITREMLLQVLEDETA